MPADLAPGADPIGAPELRTCAYHATVIENLRHLDDVDHTAVTNATAEYVRQCCKRSPK